MPGFIKFILLMGVVGVVMYLTKPTRLDYQDELARRAVYVTNPDRAAVLAMVGGHPLDRMVSERPVPDLMTWTREDDYKVLTVFRTRYATESGSKEVRTIGMFTMFFAWPDDDT